MVQTYHALSTFAHRTGKAMPPESGRRLCHSHGSEALCPGHGAAIYHPIKAPFTRHTFIQNFCGFLHMCNNTDIGGRECVERPGKLEGRPGK